MQHVAAVYYLLGEQFDADPFLILRLRGRGREEIMAMLCARRSAAEPGAAVTGAAEPEDAERVAPLEESLAAYWDSEASLDGFQATIEAPAVDAAPVKRLGAPGFWRDSKVDFITALERAYRSVTEASLDVALDKHDSPGLDLEQRIRP